MRCRLFLALLLLTAACSAGASALQDGDAEPPAPPGPVVLTTSDGLAAVAADSGEVVFEEMGAVVSPDGGVVARATARGDGTTRVTWLDPVDGRPTARVAVEATASIRVVAPDGRVALGPADIAAGPLPYPVPRTWTPLVVAAPDGTQRTYRIAANVEPEAFSPDGTSLFILTYTPAGNPTEYQVNRLDLESGEIGGVYGQDSEDERQERMGGTARTQVWAPDGKVVYTLYTTETDGVATSFIHVLNVDEGWAFCLGLPTPIGYDTASALALSPDGDRLWVTDASGGGAVIDTDALEVLDTGSFDSPGPNGMAAVSDGERVYVGSGHRILVLDGNDLHELDRWRTTRLILALRLHPGGDRLVAVTEGQLTTFPLDGDGGTNVPGLDLPFTEPLEVSGPVIPYAECAC